MSINIENLTIQELIELNGQIVNRIKGLRKQEEARIASQFRIGDVVSFTHNEKGKITGFILSTRKKEINILTENEEMWSVSPKLLVFEQTPSMKLLTLLKEILPKAMKTVISTRK